MTKDINMESQKEEIESLGLNAIKGYFEIDVDKLDRETLKHLHQKAKLGMSFEKEMALSKRAVELNYLRVFKMIAEDKKELRSLIKQKMPKYL